MTSALLEVIPGLPVATRKRSSPELLLVEALAQLSTGLIVFDEKLRVVNVTNQVRSILAIPAGVPLEGLDVRQLFSGGGLNADSVTLAMSVIDAGLGEVNTEPVFLHINDPPVSLRMRVLSLGRGCRAAWLEKLSDEYKPQIQTNGQFDHADWLTGLASRHAFESALTHALAARPDEPLAVMLLDLDRFKAVNDTLGHAAGDAVLRLVAERISSVIRKTDLVARLGGDEFAVLIYPAPTQEVPTQIANRILELVQRTYLIDGQLVNVGTSLGIAMAPVDGTVCASLMRNADLALYHSKTSGRATFHFFNSKMEARAQARRTGELELRSALARRQLEVHYQPQVDIRTHRLVGFEALVRWRHPEQGLIPPGDFLPLAEEIGVIIPLGEWVLRTACRQAVNWGEDVVIAVNASPLQFETGRFAITVRDVLNSTGLAGTRLEIEITEGILLRNEEAVLSTLYALRDMGVRIAMDDFGTGYASLSQLARFPFDKIKIDRSLSGTAGENGKNRAIVRAIAALGDSLGVSTMAEGIETAEQLERVQKDGCSSVQGYLFSKPVPANELEALISSLKDKIII